MPQMSPMMWLNLYFYFMLNMMIIMMMIYYLNLFKFNKTMNLIKLIKTYYKLKW